MYYRLKLEGHKFYELARDGNRRTQLLELDELLLPPASRSGGADPGRTAGNYEFRALAIDTGPARRQLSRDNAGDVGLAGRRADAAVAARRVAGGRGLPQSAGGAHDARSRSTESADGNTFYIDSGDGPKQFDPNRIDSTISRGRWRNGRSSTPRGELHVFHIHQTDFQVTEINGVAQPFTGHQDNVNVDVPAPSVDAPPGQVKLLIDFRNPNIVGKFVYHCHILEHEDGGMMAVAEVVPSISAAARSLATRVANVVRTALGREAIEDEREAIERAERTLNALQSGSYCAPGGAAKPGQGAPAPSSADEAT